MTLSVADVSGVYSAIANVATATIAAVTLLFAYVQINAWRAEKRFDRESLLLQETFEILTEIRGDIVEAKAAKLFERGETTKDTRDLQAAFYDRLLVIIPKITRLKYCWALQRTLIPSPALSGIFEAAIVACEQIISSQGFFYAAPPGPDLELELPRSYIQARKTLERAAGIEIFEGEIREKMRRKAQRHQDVKFFDSLISRVTTIIGQHADGSRIG